MNYLEQPSECCLYSTKQVRRRKIEQSAECGGLRNFLLAQRPWQQNMAILQPQHAIYLDPFFPARPRSRQSCGGRQTRSTSPRLAEVPPWRSSAWRKGTRGFAEHFGLRRLRAKGLRAASGPRWISQMRVALLPFQPAACSYCLLFFAPRRKHSFVTQARLLRMLSFRLRPLSTAPTPAKW